MLAEKSLSGIFATTSPVWGSSFLRSVFAGRAQAAAEDEAEPAEVEAEPVSLQVARSVALRRCGLLIGGGSATLAIAPVDVPRTAATAAYHHNGDQEDLHNGYEDSGLDEVSLANYNAPSSLHVSYATNISE